MNENVNKKVFFFLFVIFVEKFEEVVEIGINNNNNILVEVE